jgi:alpha-beta hydrolase superfamily lysophospholipase
VTKETAGPAPVEQPTVKAPAHPPRWRRWLAWTLAIVLVLAIVAVGAGSWYYADQIMARPGKSTPVRAALVDVRPGSGDTGTVRLRGTDELLARAQVVGLRTDRAYLQLGAPTGAAGGVVTRPATLLRGTWPRPGEQGAMDLDAFPADAPAVALGHVREVSLAGPLGPLPAWRVEGSPTAGGTARRATHRDTWVLFVHGRGASRAEGLRLLSVTARLGYPALDITYRNDDGAPASPDNRNHWGLTEWTDVQAGMDYLEAHGARHVVLAAASMGGALATTFLRRSADAGLVSAVILDAPMLSLRTTLRLEAAHRGLPGPVAGVLLPVAEAIAHVRGQLDVDALEQTRAAGSFHAPILLLHGTADPTVPISTSDAFAATRPDLVTYLRFPGAQHVQSWNVDRARYERAVTAFLAAHAR